MAQTKYFSALFLIIILIGSLSLMLYASFTDSAIMDELAHIPAGYSYVKYLDYRLNPEHPPLLKALAGLPLLFQKINFPLESDSWQKDINGQWDIGTKFLYQSGNDADKIIFLSRLAPILFTLLLIILIYFWSKELLGKTWAFLPTILTAFSPTILAHGHYVTTDVAATLGISAATYYFLKFLLQPSTKNIIIAGLIFGLAQLTKFSVLLLIPFFIIIAFSFYLYRKKTIKDDSENKLKSIWFYLYSLLIIFLIGYFIVYNFYFVFTLNYPSQKQLYDSQFILNSFSPRFLADFDIALIKNPFTRPLAHYLLGVLMVLQRTAGGNTAYFMGEISAAGWKSYFPIVYLLKEPLPFLIMLIIALFSALFRLASKIKNHFNFRIQWSNFLNYLGNFSSEFALLVFVVIYWAYSLKSHLNIGVRHLLPTFPFIYILTASGLKNWWNHSFNKSAPEKLFSWLKQKMKIILEIFLKGGLIFILVFFYLIESLSATPYFLSYFNEIGGGVWNGYRYVTDSNYDWGQDLKRLKQWAEKNDVSKIAVDYFGGGNPKYYLGENKVEYWWSAKGNPSKALTNADFTPINLDRFPRQSASSPRESATKIEWLAISVNNLQGAVAKTAPGQKRNPSDEYLWLQELKPKPAGLGQLPQPDFRAGTSIFIYHL